MRMLFGGIVLLLASAAAFAQDQDQGFYIGGHFGQAQVDGFCDGVSGAGVSCDDKDTGWKIVGGYKVNRNFAVEAAYVGYGEVKASSPAGTVDAEATAFEATAVGILPLANRFSAYGKLGLYFSSTDASVNTTTVVGDESEEKTDLTFGLGVSYDVTPQVAVRGEWQRYQDVGGGDIGEADIDVLSVGAVFRF